MERGRLKTGRVLLAAACALLLAQGCSTRPRNPGEIFDVRGRAESQLELGNRHADRGDAETALFLIDDAMRLAVLADDAGLLVRAGLSRSNVLAHLGYADEAEAGRNRALAEALLSGNRELVALSRLHIARAGLFSPNAAGTALSVAEEAARERAHLSNRLHVAFAWSVEGLAEMALGRHARAEAALLQSLAIHERGRYFELAALDWFTIASFRSRSGDFDGARRALETSIEFDRRVENSWGLAAGWRALGDVETRAGNRDAARAAFLRSAGIFLALGNERAAEDALARIDGQPSGNH